MRLRSLLVGVITLTITSAGLIASPAQAIADDPIEKIEPSLRVASTSRAIVRVRTPQEVGAVAAQAEELAPGSGQVVPAPDELAGKLNFFVYEGGAEEFKKLAGRANVISIREDKINSPSLVRSTAVIGADKAQAAGVDGTGQSVVVLDTGIDTDHPFLAGRITAEACFSAESPAENATSLCPSGAPFQLGPGAADATIDKCMRNVGPADATNGICRHGTHVAGIAGGKSHPSQREPSNGVAPGARIIPVQVFSRFDDSPYCGDRPACVLAFDSSILTGMAYANLIAEQYQVASVNLSLGGGTYTSYCDTGEGAEFKAQTDQLIAKGAATVVAAGNDGMDASVSWPACVSSVVAVGSTDVDYPQVGTKTDDVSDFSNRGAMLDLFAPGWPIFSSVPDDLYAGLGGTSMAAPHVAGAFALMRQAFPGASVTEILAKLKAAGKPITYASAGAQVTTPRLDVWNAVPHQSCAAAYTSDDTWPGGFRGEVTVENTGNQPLDGWKVTWTFSDRQKVTQTWNGRHHQSGRNVSVTNADWNGDLAPGERERFGVRGSWRGGERVEPATLTCAPA